MVYTFNFTPPRQERSRFDFPRWHNFLSVNKVLEFLLNLFGTYHTVDFNKKEVQILDMIKWSNTLVSL